MPEYPQQWPPSDLEGAVASSPNSYIDPPMPISDDSYPQSVQQSEGIEPDTSFRKTLLEIEYTFYKTFPAAAHAAQSNQPWGVVEDGGCSQDPVMYFYPSTGTTMDCSASNSLSSGPAAFASAPSGRARANSDVLMDGSIHATHLYSVHAATPSSLSALSPNTVVHPSAPISQSSVSLHASTSTLSPISDPSSVGSLSEACRFHSTLNSGQSNYGQPYVTSGAKEDDGGVPPMASLMCPAKMAPSPSSALVKTTSSPLPCQYPAQTIPRAINIPLSPHSMSTGYHGASPSNPSTPNQQIDGNSPDPSSSPSSITLYPVPQAPVNYNSAVPPWPPHLISEPVPHPPSGRESSTARRRKKNKDNDKKPPLACLFCRGRKIACGAPSPDGDGKTCNQCARRGQKCDYPAESRRGMRKDKSLSNLNPDGAKGIVKSKKRS